MVRIKDSLIYVKQDANEYILTEGSTAEYGIDVDATLLKKIPDLLNWKEQTT